MKKLIDELELERADMSRSNCDYGELSGFAAAVDIVRAHNPWYEVSELPPVDESEPDFSIDVMVTNGEGYRLGYYAFRTKSWVLHKYFRGSHPTHWAYLPEAKP